ncbi:aminomethyl-transferring glycine dehydrogenase subunit GcvPA [bacterium]|nr:MAG: aminomethyl-transferring glycine dehydrogenase subunit GcvPA [bacterium]
MLTVVGAPTLGELARVPDAVALKVRLDLPQATAEIDLLRRFEHLAARDTGVAYRQFVGAGAYHHYVPPVLGALAMRGEFLTAYTPYQAEVSQGSLQAIYEWQTYVCLLTGLDIANASVYDGATAMAEAAIMAINATGHRTLLVSRAVHPNYRVVLKTYADGLDAVIEEIPDTAGGITDWQQLAERLAAKDVAAVVVQSPNFFGNVDTPDEASQQAIKAAGALLIGVVAEALSLAVLQPPAHWGADIAVGEAQSFGVSLAYGGPYVGFMATTKEHLRRLPGRLAGKSVDAQGRTAYVLTLQAREQHIRREKATSNICTNQAHCALLATMYLAAVGNTGLRAIATENLRRSRQLATAVANVPGFRLAHQAPFFNELVVRVPGRAGDVLAALEAKGILGGVDLGRWYPEYADAILMTATELTTDADIDALSAALKEVPARAAAV